MEIHFCLYKKYIKKLLAERILNNDFFLYQPNANALKHHYSGDLSLSFAWSSQISNDCGKIAH